MSKLLLLLTLVVMLVIAVVRYQTGEYEAFMKTAQTASATIVEVDRQKKTPKDNMGSDKTVTYEYTDMHGQLHRVQAKIEYADIWNDLKPGQQYKVYYDPESPETSHLAMVMDRRLNIGHTVSEIETKRE